MKRGNTRRTWGDANMRAAGAACAAQLPVAGAVAFVLSLDDDTYGAAGGPAIGLACVVLFAPLLLPLLGLLHSAVLTLPACRLGRRAAATRWGRGRGPEWAWSLGCLLPVGAAWAAPFAALGAPFAALALWIAASGVVPALNVAYCRRREERLGRPLRKVWILSGLASLGLCATIVGAAVVATLTGFIKEYEPPRPTTGQLAGVWRGEGGEAELRLYGSGRAELRGCAADAAWKVGVDTVLHRPAVLLEGRGAECGASPAWIIGGTQDDLELFVTSGDPDSPDVKILRRG